MRYLVFLLLFAGSSSVFGQAHFKPGLYITLTGDTVKGLVDFRGIIFNSGQCDFKAGDDQSVQTFLPGQIHGYVTESGKFFVSKKAELDGRTRELFLECLVKGELTLYYVRNADGVDYYFVEKKDGKLTTMNNNRKVVMDDGKGKVEGVTNQYKGVMNYYMKEAPPLQQRVTTLRYNRGSLIDLTKKYHEAVCTSDEKCIVFERVDKKDRMRVGVSLVAGRHSILYTGPSSSVELDGSATTLGVAAVMDRQMQALNERSHFNLRFSYHQLSYTTKNESSSWNHYDQTGKAADFKLDGNFVYLYPKQNVLIFAGPFLEYLLFFDDKTRSTFGPVEMSLIKNYFCFGGAAGVGAELGKNMRLTFSYEMNNRRLGSAKFNKDGFEAQLTYFIR
jgi:hypothetical protein